MTCFVLVFVTILFTVGFATDQSCVPNTPKPLRCGGALQSQEGTLYYKPYERVEDNERCVWTLSTTTLAATNGQFDFHILYKGFPFIENETDIGPHLTFSGVDFSVFSQAHVVNATGKFTIGGESGRTITTIVIVLSSGTGAWDRNNTGFILEYRTPGAGYQNHFVVTPPIQERIDSSGYQYSEEVVVVVPPENNYFPGRKFPIIGAELANCTSGDCSPYLSTFHYNRTRITQPWQIAPGARWGNGSILLEGHDDISLMRYSSYWRDDLLFNLRCNCDTVSCRNTL